MFALWFALKALAAIFGVAMAAAVLILFVPIRYWLDVAYNGEIFVLLKASWLLRVFTIKYETNGAPAFAIKVFGLGKKGVGGVEDGRHYNKREKREQLNSRKTDGGKKKKRGSAEMGEGEAKPTLMDRFEGVKSKLDMFASYQYKQALWEKTMLYLKRSLKALAPEEAGADCRFGMADPAASGMLLGAAQALLGVANLYGHVRVSADFERQFVDLKGHLKGKIRIWPLFWPLVAYAASKPVWFIIKPIIFKKGRKGEIS